MGCYGQVLADLRRFQPEWILTGHTRPYQTCPEWYEAIERGARAFDEVHRSLMLLDDDDAHFGPESQGGKLKPYQLHLPAGGVAEFSGWILNPFPTPQKATIRLVAAAGWESQELEVDLGPRQQKDIRIAITPAAGSRCRRQPIGLDLQVGGRPCGQVSEALVTVGYPRF